LALCGDGGGRDGGREREGRAGHLLTWWQGGDK